MLYIYEYTKSGKEKKKNIKQFHQIGDPTYGLRGAQGRDDRILGQKYPPFVLFEI